MYVTGRSADGRPAVDLGGTVEDTAASVTEAGGRGVAVRCDHLDDEAVAGVFERVHEEHGGLDVLVNSVWAGYEILHAGGHGDWVRPFWEQTIDMWDPMFEAGVRAHYVPTLLAARIMVPQRRGLIVSISHVTAEGLTVGDNVAYSVAKSADNRMMRDMATQLRPHDVTARGPRDAPSAPQQVGRIEQGQALGARVDVAQLGDDQLFAGRAVAARRSQCAGANGARCADLAHEYGFTDVDGKVPEPLPPTFQ